MADEDEQKGQIEDPYSNLQEIFPSQFTFIEQHLNAEDPQPDPPIFEKSYKVLSLTDWDEKKAAEYEYGNRIVAPDQDFRILLQKGAETPIILQILNQSLPNKISHCSVIEWTAPKGIIYVPSWMMFDFQLQTANGKQPELTLRYYEKPFLKGSFLQIQPYMLASIQSDEFKDVQKLFELSLKKYQCLTIGDTLRIQHNKNIHLFEVHDVLSAQSIAGVTPFNVVSIINTDVAVDFLPPKDMPAQPDNDHDNGYDVNVDPKSIPPADGIIQPTHSSDQYVNGKQIDDFKVNNQQEKPAISGTGHKLNDSKDNAQDDEHVVSMDVKAVKIVCNESEKTTRIQLVIGGKREAVKVNLTTTVKELYAHAKSVSGYERFRLKAGFPPKVLENLDANVKDEQLTGARITVEGL